MTTSMEKRVKDNHPHSRHLHYEQELYWRGASACCRCPSHASQPPHPRGLQPHCLEATKVRLSSMFPASVSIGLSRISHGRHHRLRTECLAHEVRVDAALCCHFWERLPESVRRQGLLTASLHESRAWFLVGGRWGHVSRRYDLRRPTFFSTDQSPLAQFISLSKVRGCEGLVLL